MANGLAGSRSMLKERPDPFNAAEADRRLIARLAIESAVAARRHRLNHALTQRDLRSLRAVRARLNEAADAIVYVRTSGEKGRAPSQFSSVDVTIKAVQAFSDADSQNVESQLVKLVSSVNDLAESRSRDDQDSELERFFTSLYHRTERGRATKKSQLVDA